MVYSFQVQMELQFEFVFTLSQVEVRNALTPKGNHFNLKVKVNQ